MEWITLFYTLRLTLQCAGILHGAGCAAPKMQLTGRSRKKQSGIQASEANYVFDS